MTTNDDESAEVAGIVRGLILGTRWLMEIDDLLGRPSDGDVTHGAAVVEAVRQLVAERDRLRSRNAMLRRAYRIVHKDRQAFLEELGEHDRRAAT